MGAVGGGGGDEEGVSDFVFPLKYHIHYTVGVHPFLVVSNSDIAPNIGSVCTLCTLDFLSALAEQLQRLYDGFLSECT